VPVDVGAGPAIALLHGYGMRPWVYRATAGMLAERARVVVPDLFDVPGHWEPDRVTDALAATLDDLGIGEATLVGHSFGGGIQLGFAASRPVRVTELVFSDTLAVSEEWGLADEALRHPVRLMRLVTAQAAVAFAESWVGHPRQMLSGAWWGFRSRRSDDIEAVARAGIRSHVLWANRDSILRRSDGRAFAERLGATFTVARSSDGPVDHDWVFQDPVLFVAHLRALGLAALSG
jgi:pimeloyl-ACP methyl ester carboxylesterase